MTLFKNKYRVESARLKGWDYSVNGYYFVTICTKNSELFFGNVRNGIMGLNKLGCITCEQWLKTAQLRKNVILNEWVIMPNHVHGIIIINTSPVETHCNASLRNDNNYKNNRFGPQYNNLASIVRGFKSSVKRICNKNNIPFAWQPRFYDHIIRNEESLNKIQQYILNNPWKWEMDRNNPENLWM